MSDHILNFVLCPHCDGNVGEPGHHHCPEGRAAAEREIAYLFENDKPVPYPQFFTQPRAARDADLVGYDQLSREVGELRAGNERLRGSMNSLARTFWTQSEECLDRRDAIAPFGSIHSEKRRSAWEEAARAFRSAAEATDRAAAEQEGES